METNKDISRPNGPDDKAAEARALAVRLGGRLNTVDIAGHTFYVDIPMNCLRPKDDFTTLGINFSEIENYLSKDGKSYQIPYDPGTHRLREPDYDNITSIPSGILMIEFPGEQQLDPVGYARKYKLDLKECLKEIPFKAHFKASVIDWKDTWLPAVIKGNIQRAREVQKKQNRHRGKGSGRRKK